MYIIKDIKKKAIIDKILANNYDNMPKSLPEYRAARPVEVKPLISGDAGGLEAVSSSLPDRGLVSFDPLKGTFREVK